MFFGWTSKSAFAADEGVYQIGVARVDITPSFNLRLCGYAARGSESEGVEQKLWAKALAIGGDDEGVAILLTVDNTAVPAVVTEEVAARLKKKVNLPRERLVVCSSHTHAGPCLEGSLDNMFGKPIPADQEERIARYTRELTDNMEKVALAAIADRRPGRLAWGIGKADFAANRRTKGGPVDHDMPLLRAVDLDGKLRAILVEYACHCTTLGSEMNKFCGDWAGYAQQYMEQDHPSAIAMVAIGCGADANPSPRGALRNAELHGKSIATEASRLLQTPLKPLTGKLATGFKRIELPYDTLPTRQEWEERAKKTDHMSNNARIQLARLARGEAIPTSLPYPVQTWTFGDQLAMVFLGGEVVVDYSLRLKQEFDGRRLWVMGYSNDVPCYIPSRRILKEGGYEAETAMIYYARPGRLAPIVENRIIETVHELLPREFRSEKSKAEFPLPKSPKEALATFQLRDDLTIELVAAEPLVQSPVNINFGPDGKLWVAEMYDFPSGPRGVVGEPGGRVVYLEDTDGDGKYDKRTVFLDHVRYPTSVLPWRKGVLITAAPDVIYAEDTDGDGKADIRKVLFTGFSPDNEQWEVNGLCYGLDNWVYAGSSIHNNPIRVIATGQVIQLGNRDFRFNPDNSAFEPASGHTQFNRIRDDFGNWFGNDNSNLLWHYPLAEHYVRRNPHVAAPNPAVHIPSDPEPNKLYPASKTLERYNFPESANRTTSSCGPAIYRDNLLGDEFFGNAFVCEPVHNMVHRLILKPNGVTFEGHRAPENRKSEFLASTDNWSRPVQVTTGPDGALWVVDMYRFVVEHPRWITPDRYYKIDDRAGDDMGRIYRVYPKGKSPRVVPNLTKLSTVQLAKMIDNPNGPVRDLVQQQLIHRGDAACMPVLQRIARESKLPQSRIQSIYVLREFGSLEAAVQALKDPDATVRCNALRVMEPWLGKSPELVEGLVADGDVRVRFQLALTLGVSPGPGFGSMLGRLAAADIKDTWMRAAVVSSANGQARQVLETVLNISGASAARDELAGRLVSVLAATADPQDLAWLYEVISPGADKKVTSWHLAAWANTLDALDRRRSSLPEFQSSIDQAMRRNGRVVDAARLIAKDDGADESTRLAAVNLLGRDGDQQNQDLKLLASLMQSRFSLGLQSTALASLRRTRDMEAAGALLTVWPKASPVLRSSILDTLMSRAEWLGMLLDAIEKETLLPIEIDAKHRDLLLKYSDPAIRDRATKLLAAVKPSGSRAQILDQFKPALSLQGNPANGSALFAKACATCHALGGQGYAVGPDLAALTDRSGPGLLTAILDPNVAVDGKYISYIVDLTDGRTLTGIVANETASSITIVQGNNVRDIVLRSEIKSLRSSKLSMMPEGLEQGMTLQDLADLMAYVRSK
jgi:putative membrane-bound dehydrogenase-like protein